MAQENETKEVIDSFHIKAEKPTRKGVHKYIRVYRFVPYLTGIIAIILVIIALAELFNIANSTFVGGYEAFYFCLLFAIFSMVSRMYYKIFEEGFEK